jgi:DNA-directed RNA polymerase specialized sigma24 family protein
MTPNRCTHRPVPRPPATALDCSGRLRWLAEWDWWKDRPHARAAVAHWRSRHPEFAALATADQVAAACGLDRTVPDHDADARLALLVGEARHGDHAAARVAVHRVFPALLARAASRTRTGSGTFPALLGDYTTAAWLATACYPLERRPTKIAGNIVWEAELQLFGRRRIVDRRTFPLPDLDDIAPPADLDGTPADADPDPLVELLDLLAAARRHGLDADELRLLADLAVHGRTQADVAARTGVTDRTVRTRRRTALTRLARVLDLPAPPARTRRGAAA